MGNCCNKGTTTNSDAGAGNSSIVDTIKDATDLNEEKALLKSTPSCSPSQDTPPRRKSLEEEPVIHDEKLPEELNQQDSAEKEGTLNNEEPSSEENLIASHLVPMTGDRLLINELKTKYPEGLEDLKRRTRESLQRSFRKGNQKSVSLPSPIQVKYDSLQRQSSEELLNNLKTLEEKLRNTQKLIVNNTELSMSNTLEQFKLDLANVETSLHPMVIDKRKEVYNKLKACFSLSIPQEKSKELAIIEEDTQDTKKSTELLKLESLNQKCTYFETCLEESKDIFETQKEIEDILVYLENISATRQEELTLKDYLREKSLYLIKECILKNMR